MSSEKEAYKYILNEYLKIVFHFSDKDYQKRVWIENKGPECQAFDDAVCDFFDIGDPILDKYEKFGVSKFQFDLLEEFRSQFERFSAAHDLPQLFIDTPEWDKIVGMAKQVLAAFKREKNEDL